MISTSFALIIQMSILQTTEKPTGKSRVIDVKEVIVNDEESEAKSGQEDCDEDPELFCMCQQPYDETRVMIMCDYCGQFYHLECINITKEEAEGINTFICQICSDKDCNSPLYHEGMSKIAIMTTTILQL